MINIASLAFYYNQSLVFLTRQHLQSHWKNWKTKEKTSKELMTEFEEELITNWHRMNLQYQSLVELLHLLKLAGGEAVVAEWPV